LGAKRKRGCEGFAGAGQSLQGATKRSRGVLDGKSVRLVVDDIRFLFAMIDEGNG
jgi:hypothetical protein